MSKKPPKSGDDKPRNASDDEESMEKVITQSLRKQEATKTITKDNRRRHSFSYRPIKKISQKKKRRNSIEYKPQKFKYIAKPKENETPALTKSAETILYESLHRLATTYPHLIRDISDFVFLQIIGHGGFGEVWLANDLRTGKLVAIKELFAEKLVGRNLTSFCREIVTMGRCNNRFVIPFVGFTVEKPYTIITEYMPNGSLHPYLRKEKINAPPVFSGTHLTMIAIGLIVAIRYLHVQRIVHRDIKAANVLLDHHFLPKLCDFGISRFINKKVMTDAIGTASHMAPELMVTTNYDFKVDVFAYAATLYEMVEKKNPFAGRPLKEVITNIRTGKRPIFRRPDTPECLIDLIKRCWDQHPKNRPTPMQIFEEFATGKVYFAGTKPEPVKEFCDMLSKELEKLTFTRTANKGVSNRWQNDVITQLHQKMTRAQMKDQMMMSFGIPLSEDIVEDEFPLMKEDKEEKEIETEDEFEKAHAQKAEVVGKDDTKKEPSLKEILSDSHHPHFKSTVIELCDTTTAEEFTPLYAILLKYFRQKDDEKVMIFILENYNRLINRERKIVKIFEQYHFFSLLPVESDKAQVATLNFIASIFEITPNAIQSTIFRAIAALFKTYPAQTLHLFAHFIHRYGRLRSPDPALDFLVRWARNFINIDCGEVYVKLIYQLTQIDEFAKDRMDNLKQTISAFTRSKNTAVMAAAMNAFALLYKEGDQVPFDAIIRALPNITSSDACAHILMRSPSYPASKTLFKALADKAARPKIARVLAKFASQSKDHLKICASSTKWMNVANSFTYRTFLIIFADQVYRQNIMRSKRFPQFITKCIRYFPDEVLPSLGTVLRRANLNQGMIYNLEDAEFFDALSEKMKIMENNEQMMLGSFVILDCCVRSGYTPKFKLFFDQLSSLLQKSNNLTKPAALMFVSLSSHSKIAAAFKHVGGLVKYFEMLKSKGILRDAATVFLNNINSV